MDDGRQTGGRREEARSKGRVVVSVWTVRVRDGLPVTPQDVVEGASATEQLLGQLRDDVAVVAYPPVLVAEQMRILGEQGEAGDVQGVAEQIERSELRSAQQVDGRQRGRRGRPGVRRGLHRFLAAPRLAAGGGAWNRSK